MTSSSLPQQKLVLNILGEHFGEIVRIVAQAVMRVEKSTLTQIVARVQKDIAEGPRRTGPSGQLKVSPKQVRNALLVLIQHNCLAPLMPTELECSKSKPPLKLYYKLLTHEVLQRLHFANYANHTHKLFKDTGACIVEALLLHGRLKRAEILRLSETALLADPDLVMDDYENSKRAVEKVFEAMVQKRYIVKVPALDLTRFCPPPDRSATLKKGMDFAAPIVPRTAGGRGSRGGRGGRGSRGGKAAAGVSTSEKDTAVVTVREKTRFEQSDSDEDDSVMPLEMMVAASSAFAMNAAFRPQSDRYSGTGGGGIPRRPGPSPYRDEEDAEAEFEDLPATSTTSKRGGRGAVRGGRARGGSVRGRGARGGGSAASRAAAALAALNDGDSSDQDLGGGKRAKRKGPVIEDSSNSDDDVASSGKASTAAASKRKREAGSDDKDAEGTAANGGSAAAAAASKAPPAKKSRKDVQALTVWRLGVDQFHRDFRHNNMLKLVKDELRQPGAVDIMRAMLKISDLREQSSCDESSCPIEKEELLKHLRATNKTYATNDGRPPGPMTDALMSSYLTAMQRDNLAFITQLGERGFNGPRYRVNLGHMIAALKKKALHSAIRYKYGVQTARICRILLDKKYLEQSALCELAMLPPKETRHRLYELYRDHFVSLQEVPRQPNHSFTNTIYLWTVQSPLVSATLINNMQKAMLNTRLRRQHLYNTNKLIIEEEVRQIGAPQLSAAAKKLAKPDKALTAGERSKVLSHLERLNMNELLLAETLLLFLTF